MAMTRKQMAMQDFVPFGRGGRAPGGQVQWNQVEQPAASPIDTYQRPAVQQVPQSPLMELGKSLSSFSSTLGDLTESYAQRAAKAEREAQKLQDQTDEAEAKRLWIANNGQSYADAVKQGKIPPQASPHFMEAYQTVEGDALGRKAAADIETDYQKWEGRGGNDTQAFSDWMAGKVKEKFGGVTDPAVLNGAWGHITALQAKLSNTYQKETADGLYQGALDNAGVSVGETVKQIFREGGERGNYDFATGGAQLDALTDSLRKTGVKGADLNRAEIDAVVARAAELQDPSVLDILTRKRANGSPGPGHTQYGMEQIEKARRLILHDMEQGEDRAWKRQERVNKENTRYAIRSVVSLLGQNPTAPIPPELIDVGSSGDPDFALKAEQIRKHLNDVRTQDDPDRLHAAVSRVYGSDNAVQQVFNEWADGNIRSPTTARSMLDDARRIDEARNRGNQGVLQMDIYKRAQDAIKKKMDPVGMNPHVADAALYDMEVAAAEWEAKNPKASRIEKMKAVKEITDLYQSSVNPAGQYETNPMPSAPGQTGSVAPNSPAVQAVTNAATRNGVNPDHALTTANIESNIGRDPGAANIGEVRPSTAASVGASPGGGVNQQADTMAKVWKRSGEIAKTSLGRDPEPWQSYVVYQQGPGGGPALLKADPKARAVDVLTQVYGNPTNATSAIVKNGGTADMTAGDFLNHIKQLWAAKQTKAPT